MSPLFNDLVKICILLTILHCSAAQECRVNYQLLNDRQVINITSPNYPSPYPQGTNCRYRITAPMDHVLVANCYFEVAPNGCDTEYFVISLDGDFQLRDGENYCRSTRLTRMSHFRHMVLAYASIRPNTVRRGRFGCQIMARRQPCNCGWSVNTRITNGQETRRHEIPSIVALRDATSPQRVFCGGSIISHRHILTAAHCMRTHTNPSRILAYAGDHDLSTANESPFEAQYRIQNIINHPRYSQAGNAIVNDIAILITSTPIEWSRGVGPICLPWRQQTELFAFIGVDVAGWGTLSFAGPKSATLQKAQLLTVANRNCQEQYNDTLIQSSHLCTYDYRGLGKDSCQYDSGGPVIMRTQRMTLLGIISFGRSCGSRYGTGVNTRITSHLGWIWSFTQYDVCLL